VIEILEDPFENYPEIKKEREKARKLLEKEAKLGRPPSTRGGWRPGSGGKVKEYKVYRAAFTILKTDEELVNKEIEVLKSKYSKELK